MGKDVLALKFICMCLCVYRGQVVFNSQCCSIIKGTLTQKKICFLLAHDCQPMSRFLFENDRSWISLNSQRHLLTYITGESEWVDVVSVTAGVRNSDDVVGLRLPLHLLALLLSMVNFILMTGPAQKLTTNIQSKDTGFVAKRESPKWLWHRYCDWETGVLGQSGSQAHSDGEGAVTDASLD